jgi:ABC-2 type transport system permease protein
VNLRRLSAVSRKETIHIVRDPWSLGMAIAIPMLLLVLFGWALSLDVDRVPMAVWDLSGTPASRDLAARFAASRYFDVRRRAEGYGEIEDALDRGDALLGLVIPRDFSGRPGAGRAASVQVIADGSDSNTATIALGYARAVVRAASAEVAVEEARRSGLRPQADPVEVRPRMWFNDDMESRNSIIPGLIAVIMMVIAALLTSLTVAREWERGTMEGLISTPVTRAELILGKLLPYFAVGMLDVLAAVLMGEFLFAVPLRGSAGLLFAASAVFLAGALSLGILISAMARTQLLASQMAMVLTFVPAFLLSGFTFPIANMPDPIQAVTVVVPARWFVALLKGIYMRGVGIGVLWAEGTFLIVFSIIAVTVAIRKFRKKL